METRAEYFTSEWRSKFEDFIIDEMKTRARAAEDLAENFSVNGIVIQPGCDTDGTIHIIKGFDELLSCFDLTRETVKADKCTAYIGDIGYEAYNFKLPEIVGRFHYIDLEKSIGEKAKVMPYD